MPKKTKKEKALAQARRIVQNARLQSSIAPPHINQTEKTEVHIPSTFEFTAKTVPASPSKTEKTDEQEFGAIRKDIVKTVVLAGAAIAFEFIVYLRLGK